MVGSGILYSLGKRLLPLAAVVLCLTLVSAQAGPLEEVKALSRIPSLNLASLKKGQIATQRGPEGKFDRGLSLESCYFIHAPMTVVGAKLLHWDPSPHAEMENRLYHEYNLAKPHEPFRALRLDPAISKDKWLLEHTYAIANGDSTKDLHLTAAEATLIREVVPNAKAASVAARADRANEAWRRILQARSNSLAQGGMKAVAPYSAAGAISPGSELRGLLTLNAIAAKHFRPVMNARPFTASGPAASEAVGYWETAEVRGHTTLQLGVFTAHKSADSWQLADCVYYPTDTYFMALDLFQLWPLDDGTLVWQAGYVSAPFRGYLGGIDRYVAGKQQTEETIATVKAFRSDVEKQH